MNLKRVGLAIGGIFAIGLSALTVMKVAEARGSNAAAARMKAELDLISPAGSNKLAVLNRVYKGENVYYVVSPATTAYCWANIGHEYVSGFGTSQVCTDYVDLILAKIDEVRP